MTCMVDSSGRGYGAQWFYEESLGVAPIRAAIADESGYGRSWARISLRRLVRVMFSDAAMRCTVDVMSVMLVTHSLA